MAIAGAPPRGAGWLLLLLYPEPLSAAVAGDLEEEFHERRAHKGAAAARRWYWRQVLLSAGPAARRRLAKGDAVALAAIVLAGFGALWLMTEVGRFVLSQVPLKTGVELPAWLEAARWGGAGLVLALGLRWWRQEKQGENSR